MKNNKNDRVDAEPIPRAAMRPSMRFDAVKSHRQPDGQALHRAQEDVIPQDTAKANQIRGLAAKYDVIAPLGLNQLRTAIPKWLA